jgi:hypothetical protein
MYESVRYEPTKPVIFGANAIALCQAGLAVLPALGKKPLCRGFSKWTRAPSLSVVES